MSRDSLMAVLRSGIVSPDVLEEIRRWKLPLDIPKEQVGPSFETAEEVIGALQESLEQESRVEIRDTDLDIMKAYLGDSRKARLVVKGESVSVTYCQITTGEYAIPWISESIVDLLLDGESHLKIGRKKVFFYDVREVFFGEMKAFMVCAPGHREKDE